MLAEWEKDGSKNREDFMGSEKIKTMNGDTDRGWIYADVFGNISLKK